MSDNDGIPQLERITFFAGQQLTADDLTALETANRELRWLHNRSLHAWGVAVGLEVTGQRGASSVAINPGYGIDSLGREIILTGQQIKTVPAVVGGQSGTEAIYYLVAVYQVDSDQQVAEHRPGVCLPGDTVRLTEEPLLDWRLPDELQEGRELVLAKAWIRNCQLSRPLSLAERRYARPSQQPYIAAGQTMLGGTDWHELSIQNQTAGVFTQVDSSAAGFRTTPAYVAHIVGDRFLQFQTGVLLAAFAAVVDAKPDQFTLQVLLPDFGQNAGVNQPLPSQFEDAVKNELKWYVVWMGIEG
jgi:hypothetical protein